MGSSLVAGTRNDSSFSNCFLGLASVIVEVINQKMIDFRLNEL